MNLTYKFRLYPNKTQTQALEHALAVGWRIYNDVHHLRESDYRESGKRWKWQELDRLFGEERRKYVYLQAIPYDTVTQLIKRHEKALKAFFERRDQGVGYPKEKRRCDFLSIPYRYNSGIKWIPVRPGLARLRIFEVGTVRMRQHRPLPCGCSIKQIVVGKSKQGKWYASFQLELPNLEPPIHDGGIVGIDLGIHYLLALSDGQVIENPRWYREAQAKRRILARKIERQRRANNPGNYNPNGTVKDGAIIWRKSNHQRDTERQYAKHEEHVAEQRKYFWNQVTDWLTKTYSVIALENLTLDFMIENRKLAMSVHDAAFGMFWQMLKYKAELRGVRLIWMPPQYTSQRCSVCGHVDKENRKTQANFTCLSCGHSENADVNAAKNVLNLALQAPVQGVQDVTQPIGVNVSCEV